MSGLELRYFVLSPNKEDIYGHASREAMRAYAEIIRYENPRFSEDLDNWVYRIEREHQYKNDVQKGLEL